MRSGWIPRSLALTAALTAAVSPIAAAAAQTGSTTTRAPAQNYQSSQPYQQAPNYQSPPPGYGAQGGPGYDQQGYGQQGYGQGYDAPPGGGAYDPNYAERAPAGYDGRTPPPPPPGYRNDPAYASQPQQDQRYQAYVEDWAQNNCVKSGSNAGAGAVIGGLFGALLGSGIAGRGDHTAGAVLGGAAGAVGGAALGDSTSRAISPGCPPGYVVRRQAPAFVYEDYGAPYYYAAPTWYQPWYFVDNRWLYRPYPYHTFYYRNYYYGRPGFYGRPGYGRGYYGRGYRGRRW